MALAQLTDSPASSVQTPSRVLILGLGRSGTSWLMKIFDHHPMVFSIYEPERLVRRSGFPPGSPSPYLDALFECRGLRAMRRRPLVRKAYRSAAAHLMRKGLIYGLSGLDRLSGLDGRFSRIPIPDMGDLSRAHRVVKCVGGEKRFSRLMSDSGDMNVIYILRHPCGQIFSHLRGIRSGKMKPLHLPGRKDVAEYIELDKPADELTERDLEQLEILSLRWAVFNGMAVNAARRFGNIRTITYESLCRDPIGQARAIFAWAGIDWRPECERFLRESLEQDGDAPDYHGLRRNPRIAADKWKTRMPPEQIRRVKEICRRSPAAAFFPDLR